MVLLGFEPQGRTSLGTPVEELLESELEMVKPLGMFESEVQGRSPVTKGLLESYLEQGKTSSGILVEGLPGFVAQGKTSLGRLVEELLDPGRTSSGTLVAGLLGFAS